MKNVRLIIAVLGYSFWSAQILGQPVHFTHQTEVGLLQGKEAFIQGGRFTVQTFNGVRMNEFAEVGVTIGLDAYPDITLVPLAFGWRGVIPTTGNVSPFLALDVGYAFDWLKKRTDISWYRGGLMFNPSIGVRIRSNKVDRFLLSVGYKRQQYSHYEGRLLSDGLTVVPETDHSTLPPGFAFLQRDDYTLQRLSVRVGVMF